MNPFLVHRHEDHFARQPDAVTSPAAKEVRPYVSALIAGYEAVRDSGLIRLETVLAVQSGLEP